MMKYPCVVGNYAKIIKGIKRQLTKVWSKTTAEWLQSYLFISKPFHCFKGEKNQLSP